MRGGEEDTDPPTYGFSPSEALQRMFERAKIPMQPSDRSSDGDGFPGAGLGTANMGREQQQFDGMPGEAPSEAPSAPSGPFNLNAVQRVPDRDHRNAFLEARTRQPLDFAKRAIDYFAAERNLSTEALYRVSEYLLWRNRVRNETTDVEVGVENASARRDNSAALDGADRERDSDAGTLGAGESQQETHPWNFICTWAPKVAGPMRTAWNQWLRDRPECFEENAFLCGDMWDVWVLLACVKHSQTCATAGSGSSVMSRSAMHLSNRKNVMDIERALARLNSSSGSGRSSCTRMW